LSSLLLTNGTFNGKSQHARKVSQLVGYERPPVVHGQVGNGVKQEEGEHGDVLRGRGFEYKFEGYEF
jgi:hypothetical protein